MPAAPQRNANYTPSRRFLKNGPGETPAGADDEADIVARAKQGDHQAIRVLYLRYADWVYSRVLPIVRDPHTAEDLVQQTFVRMMTYIGSYEHRGQPVGAWLTRIARNLAIDELRRQRPDSLPESFDRPAGDADNVVPALRDAFAQVPRRGRQMLFLRHVCGYSFQELAAMTGTPASVLHSRHFRDRQKVQAALAGAQVAPMTRRSNSRSADPRAELGAERCRALAS